MISFILLCILSLLLSNEYVYFISVHSSYHYDIQSQSNSNEIRALALHEVTMVCNLALHIVFAKLNP